MTVATPTTPTATPKVKTTADVLRHAAWIIEERGWNQGDYQREGRLCAMGAINTAASASGDYGEFHDPAMHACVELATRLSGPILEWNDAPGRTAAEVTAALRAAADASERAS